MFRTAATQRGRRGRGRSRVRVCGVVMVLSTVVASVLPLAAPASADPIQPSFDRTSLPMDWVSDIEVDPVRDRAFVSAGGGYPTIQMVDGQGQLAGTLPVNHAAGMLLSPDGATLYVGVLRTNQIAMVDTASLDITYLELGDIEPLKLVWAAGMLWVSHLDGSGQHYLTAVDVSTGELHRFPPLQCRVDAVASSSAAPGVIMTGSSGLCRFAVTGGSDPTLRFVEGREIGESGVGGVEDIAITPNGKRVVVSGSAGQFDPVVTVRGLTLVDSYPAFRYPTAVAIRDDGQVAVGTTDAEGGASNGPSPTSAHVAMYAAGHTSLTRAVFISGGRDDDGAWSEELKVAPRGLAWGAEKLFVLLTESRGNHPVVTVLGGQAPTPPTAPRTIDGEHFHSIVSVPELDRAFLTTGPNGNGVYVLDRRGRVESVIEHLAGAAGMTLNRRRTKLYVGLASGDAIAIIDTKTLRTRTLRTGHNTCPSSVAVVDKHMWFTGQCWGTGGLLRVLDPATGTVRSFSGHSGSYLRTAPTDPRSVWVATAVSPTGSMIRYDITRGPNPRPKERVRVPVGSSQIDQMFSADGLHLIPVLPTTMFLPVLSPRTLSLLGAPPTQYTPVAAAVRSDGLLAAGIGYADMAAHQYQPDDWTVRLFATPLGQQLTDPGKTLPNKAHVDPRGLAFGRRDLYTVYTGFSAVHVEMMRMPPVRLVTLTAARAVYRPGQRAHLVAHLSRPLPRGTKVSIYRRESGRLTLLTRRRPDVDGNIHVRTEVRRKATYVARVPSPGGTRRHTLAVLPTT